MAGQLGAEAQRLSQQRLEKMLRSFELMCGMEGQEEAVRREVRPCCVAGPAASAAG